MKILLPLLLMLPFVGSGQQRKGYLQAYGGLSRSNEATTKGIEGISGGPKLGDAVGIGVGVGFIDFEKPYIPLTADLSFIPTRKKLNPIAGIKAGYGFFKYDPAIGTTVRGGFVSTAFAGIALPGKTVRPNIMIGGTRYTFKSTYPTKSVVTDDKRFFAAIGFLF
jgi:hypothetical protein